MNPFLDHAGVRLYLGDAAATVAALPDASVDLCVTSPPFFALRDYGTGRWEGGNPSCDHLEPMPGGTRGGSTLGHYANGLTEETTIRKVTTRRKQYGETCGKCGASRIDEQIGLERTPSEFVEKLVAAFREVHRVLKPTGVLMLEVGDTYSAGTRGAYAGEVDHPQTMQTKGSTPTSYPPRPVTDLPGKNLLGMPWRIALALQDDGWFLRGDYIWAKPNAMPSSVADRCTVAHSYLFHLSKRPHYFWDSVAIAEDVAGEPETRSGRVGRYQERAMYGDGDGTTPRRASDPSPTRNARSVWTIPTEPNGMGVCPACLAYWPRNSPAVHCGVDVVVHYAAFPPALVERTILAATSERGVCPDCGAPWRRLVEKGDPELAANTWSPNGAADQDEDPGPHSTLKHVRATETVGWQPTCDHGRDPVPATVLDPFAGSGTTLLVARQLGRQAVGVELNPLYCEIVARRLAVPDAVARAAETSTEPVQLVLG